MEGNWLRRPLDFLVEREERARIMRLASIDFERAIEFYEAGEISKEELTGFAHDYCLGLPVNAISFRKKNECCS